MDIISYQGFAKSSTSTVILKCHNYLVSYYSSKGFVIVETEVGGVDNIPINVKKQINPSHLNQDDSLLACKGYIPSIANTLNKIIIARDVYENYLSRYYDDRHVGFYNL